MSEKKRFDYSLLNLIKADDVTKYDGRGISNLTIDCRDYLANYGLFVVMTRSLAGHEKDGIAAKKAILTATFKWYTDGMPKRVRAIETAEEKKTRQYAETAATMRKAVENGTAAERKMVESIIAKSLTA